MVHVYNGRLLSPQKEWNTVICSNMGATRDYLTKSVRQMPYDITYMWNLKYDRNNPQNRDRLTDTENRLVVAKAEGLGKDGLQVWA